MKRKTEKEGRREACRQASDFNGLLTPSFRRGREIRVVARQGQGEKASDLTRVERKGEKKVDSSSH